MNIGSHICFFQRRLISCYVFLLIISLAAYAQSGGKRFSGRVVDSETYQPVPFATVRLLALSDSSLLVGGATDAEGKFRLPLPKISLCCFMSLLSDTLRFIGKYRL